MSKLTFLAPALALASALAAAEQSAAPAPPAKASVRIQSGITMKYLEAGPGNAPVVILLHGLGDSSRSWTLPMPYLARRHHVYALDQRGHGDTDAPACCYALADLAHDVVAFMDAMKVEQAALVGHSMGSFVAQYLAMHHPERVSRLVLIGSADSASATEVAGWLWDKVRSFDGKVTAEFVDEWQFNPTPVEPAFLSKVKAETSVVPLHVWRGVARALSTEDHRRFLGQIAAPTLVLWGERDPAFPRPHQERLVRAVPGAVLKAYPRVGHNTHWEIPRQIGEDIVAFLDRGGTSW